MSQYKLVRFNLNGKDVEKMVDVRASLTDMLNWCHHLPAPQGVFLALKGLYPQDELTALPAGFTLVSSHRLDVPQLDAERHLIIVKKQL